MSFEIEMNVNRRFCIRMKCLIIYEFFTFDLYLNYEEIILNKILFNYILDKFVMVEIVLESQIRQNFVLKKPFLLQLEENQELIPLSRKG